MIERIFENTQVFLGNPAYLDIVMMEGLTGSKLFGLFKPVCIDQLTSMFSFIFISEVNRYTVLAVCAFQRALTEAGNPHRC